MQVKDEDEGVGRMQEDMAEKKLLELWGRSSSFSLYSNSIGGEGKGR
jgi:hypothetical protein